jgi:hypothetical protein
VGLQDGSLPRSGSSSVFYDRELLVLARAEMKALEWSSQSPEQNIRANGAIF